MLTCRRDAAQESALAQFRQNLIAANLCPADDAAREARTAELGYDRYDDQTLLRFLRARKFDLAAAQLMWEKNETWRKEFGADEIAACVVSSLPLPPKKATRALWAAQQNRGHQNSPR